MAACTKLNSVSVLVILQYKYIARYSTLDIPGDSERIIMKGEDVT